jgi:hypothetical protein
LRANICATTIGPTPGIVINRRAVGSDFERWWISASKAAICASNAVKVSTSSFRMLRTLSGSEDSRSSTRATTASTWVMPFRKDVAVFHQVPAKSVDALGALPHQEIAGSEHDAVRLLLFGLDRHEAMLGRWAASQMASASAASFFCRLMNGLAHKCRRGASTPSPFRPLNVRGGNDSSCPTPERLTACVDSSSIDMLAGLSKWPSFKR